MKKYLWYLMMFIAASPGFAGNVPNQITYQGTLKESGSPVTGTRNMQFSITNADGTSVYWNSGNLQVNVTNGLFSAILSPTGVDWQNVVPYIEVSINGQALSPLEPITASAYALECGSVADGSTLSGMIAMFAGNCPTGWTRFAAMDGMFPMGGPSYGAAGGSATVPTSQGVVFSSGQGSGSFLTNWRMAVSQPGYQAGSVSNLPPYMTVVFCQKT